ncbi:MAG: M1 family peptidase [Cyclobacteriaceae bacterium]|nr:M1 family peptidase [Cyclobacteriaceae bacterium]
MRLFIYNISLIAIVFVLITSCKTAEQKSLEQLRESILLDLQSSEYADTGAEETKKVKTAFDGYKAAATRDYNLIHTKLEVSFNLESEQLFGLATIDLSPHFYPQDSLILDAKSFDIHHVYLLNRDDQKSLNYTYDNLKLKIGLTETYSRTDTFTVQIKYTANPSKVPPSAAGKNKSIADNRGLYFVNPDGSQLNKPQQIWTQGETDYNSCWFPTFDVPNQRCTQEMYITVEDRFVTLSNGKLISSTMQDDGQRTDYWLMDQPHAPYLFMMAVGEYAIVEDQWEDIPLTYYVEPAYEPYAKDIFGNTPEMLGFFSKLLNYKYPWNKYAQVVVRDFVSGAMENTTASVFMERVQVTRRELLDEDWDYIIAHELFHQWFGNLVTCESWANLTLNEAFGNYSEYLWKEYKKGTNEADYHLGKELNAYLNEAEGENKDLIRYYHEYSEDMFDNHSYAKGGLILHYLRYILGDEAFFASLSHYLKKHAFQSVEVHELRRAFEDISGKDLHWFFDQWFLASGHPKLKIDHEYIENLSSLRINVKQEQNMAKLPLYKLPAQVTLWHDEGPEHHELIINKSEQTFEIQTSRRPKSIIFDEVGVIPGIIKHKKSAKEWFTQFEKSTSVRQRMRALRELANTEDLAFKAKIIEAAIADEFWAVRQQGLDMIMGLGNKQIDSLNLVSLIETIAEKDPDNVVRSDAISILADLDADKYADIFRLCAYDSSYSIAGTCLFGYLQSSREDKDQLINLFEDETQVNIIIPLADHFAYESQYERYDWFINKLEKTSDESQWYLVRLLGQLLMTAPDSMRLEGISHLEKYALSGSKYYVRLGAYQALELNEDVEGVKEKLAYIREREKDETLRRYYHNLLEE